MILRWLISIIAIRILILLRLRVRRRINRWRIIKLLLRIITSSFNDSYLVGLRNFININISVNSLPSAATRTHNHNKQYENKYRSHDYPNNFWIGSPCWMIIICTILNTGGRNKYWWTSKCIWWWSGYNSCSSSSSRRSENSSTFHLSNLFYDLDSQNC